MKFHVTEDVSAPIEAAWTGFTDFAALEAQLAEKGAQLHRLGGWREAHPGAGWHGTVHVRGTSYPVEAHVARIAPREACAIESRIGGMECSYLSTFRALSPEDTRVDITLDLRARTLSARLILQSLKLARTQALHRIEGFVVRRGEAVERGWRRARA